MIPVLVVDDSLTVRMDLAEAFADAGFPVVPCATAAEAREAVARQRFGLVVLDVRLPDADGVDLLRELSATCPGLPVMLLSSEAEVRDRVRGLATGAAEYVGKPYDRGWVLARAGELLGAGAAPAGTTVLVIDDSPTWRATLTEAFEAEGWAVLQAPTAEDGLRVAAERRPSAIAVDLRLPGMDGATFVRRLRLDAALRAIPCLLLTASDEGDDPELWALDSGADAFARKGADVALVVARMHAVLRRAAEPSDRRTASLSGPKRILAVDDSATYLSALADALRADGYEVVLARTGEEALELLAVQAVDCVLLDVIMPGIGGRETCRRIKAAPGLRDVPVVLLTALETRDAMIDGLSDGADDFISKASDQAVLRARVRAQIRRKQLEDETRRIREDLLRKELEATEARAARAIAETRAALVDELERKNRELEAFAHSVSHDLRAPLRYIRGFTDALREDYGERLDDQGRHYLERVSDSAGRMEGLIDHLLALARMGRVEVERVPVDVSELAAAVAAELVPPGASRPVSFRIEAGVRAEADPRLVRLVLQNLLGNAVKFSARAEHARIDVGAERLSGETVYFVRDNGVGFDMSKVHLLFRPFQRLHADVDFNGTGIGLATVERIVARHGGRIWAESASGGAVFRFTLGRGGEA